MTKLKKQQTSIIVPAYDINKGTIVFPHSNKQYIELYVQLRSNGAKLSKPQIENLKIEARQMLAINYLNMEHIAAARKQYEKLLEKGLNFEGNLGLAKLAYKEKNYNNALNYLEDIRHKNDEAYYWIARTYMALGEVENVFEPIQKAFEFKSTSEDVLLLRASFYEHYYRTESTDPQHRNIAIESYAQLFEHHFFNEFNKNVPVIVKDWYLSFANYIVLLLESEQAQQAITLLKRYFELLPMTTDQKVLEAFQSKKLFINLPFKLSEYLSQAEFDHYSSVYYTEVTLAYRKQTPLLFELLAYSELIAGNREQSMQYLKLANKFQHKSPSAITLQNKIHRLKSVNEGDVQFSATSYIEKLKQIHDSFDADLKRIVEPITIQKVENTLAKLRHELELLKLQNEDEKLGKKSEEYYDLLRSIAQIYPMPIKDESYLHDVIERKLQETADRLQFEYAKQSPLSSFQNIPHLDQIWSKQRFPKLKPAKSDQYIEKQFNIVKRFPQILKLWYEAEHYYESMQFLYDKDSQNANMLVDTYFKVLEVWWVKLLGELCDGQKLFTDKEKKVYMKLGTLRYYANSTLKNYMYFMMNADCTSTQHPLKEQWRTIDISYKDNGVEEFLDWRNTSLHKSMIEFEETSKIRDKFYETIVILMNLLRELHGDELNDN